MQIVFGNINYSNEYLNNKKKIYLFLKHLDKELFLVNSYWLNDLDNNEIKKITDTKNNHKLLKKIKKIYINNSILKFVQIYYFKFYLPMILEKIDYASMSNSVENRAPYLNKDLLNFTLNYDVKKNFSLINEKKLMKDIFRNSLQKRFRNIKKHGFAFPKSLILKDNKLVKKIIKDRFLTKKNFFYKRYNEYLKNNLNENFLWNELILNISRQNLEKN